MKSFTYFQVGGSYEEINEKEKAFLDIERMDFVSIVTPKYVHFPTAKLALENGFHVVCDKPMTINLEETGFVFALTHNYVGYPVVKQARDMVCDNELDPIRKVVVKYPEGLLATKFEDEDNKQVSWRTDPQKVGPAWAMGDIRTHSENLAKYITGFEICEPCADLS